MKIIRNYRNDSVTLTPELYISTCQCQMIHRTAIDVGYDTGRDASMLQMITLILQNPGRLSVKNLGFRARLYSIEEKNVCFDEKQATSCSYLITPKGNVCRLEVEKQINSSNLTEWWAELLGSPASFVHAKSQT